MANYEATRYDFDGANLQDVQGLNTGLIIPWTDSSVPTGNIGGSAGNHTLTTPEIASHSHPASGRGGTPEIGPPTGSGGGSGYRAVHPSVSGNMNFGNTGGGGAHGHTFSGNFTGDANSVLQPYITLLYIIKT